mmetsp:Transcript_15288/g.38388  ORF Transcript_15288/g.38388 Transcript_15288/m.38388 type:complete len:1218 (+) Transcript_15288:250-3903(+)
MPRKRDPAFKGRHSLVGVAALDLVEGGVDAEGPVDRVDELLVLDLGEPLLALLEALLDVEVRHNLLPLPVVALHAGHERLHVLDALLEAAGLLLLEGGEPLLVPVRLLDRLPGEHGADLGVRDLLALVVAVAHDVQDSLHGGARVLDGAVVEVELGDALVGDGDGLDAVGKRLGVLGLGLEHALVEEGRGVGDDAAEVVVDELLGDAVAEHVGGHLLAVDRHVVNLLEVPPLDEGIGVALLVLHAAPDLGDEEGDVVVDLVVGADDAGRRDEGLVAGEGVGHEGVVEVVDLVEGVEGALGERPLGAGARGGGRLARHRRGALHEELGELVVVHGVVDREGGLGGLGRGVGRVVAAAAEHAVDGRVDGGAEGELAGHARCHRGDVVLAGVGHLLRVLEVPGVGGGLAVDDARLGGGDAVLGGVGGEEVEEELLHGLGELLEANRVLDELLDLVALEGLEVGDEVAGLAHVELRRLVEAGVDGLVGALEEAELAVLRELERGLLLAVRQALERLGGDHDRGRDVVLGLELPRGEEVLAEGEGLPGDLAVALDLEGDRLVVLRAEPDADVGGEQRAVADLELVAEGAVDGVRVVVLPPLVAPLELVRLLEDAEELADVRGDGADKGVVLVRVVDVGGEDLDHAPERELGVEDVLGADRVDHRLAAGLHHLGVVVLDDGLDLVEVLVNFVDEDGAVADHVLDALRDLRLAAARHGRGLVEEGALGGGALEVPLGVLVGRGGAALLADGVVALLDHLDLVPRGEDVGVVGLERDLLGAVLPGDGLRGEREHGVLGDIDNVGVLLVHAVAVLVKVDGLGVVLLDVLEGDGLLRLGEVLVGLAEEGDRALAGNLAEVLGPELVAEVVRGVGEAAAGVLLLRHAVDVGSVAELGLDLLLAVAKVVVGNDGHHDAARVAGADLEGAAVVVELVVLVVAHAVALLELRGLGDVGEANVLLLEPDEVGGEDDAAGGAGPVLGVEGGVVLGEVGVVAVAEDGLDEVEVGDHGARGDEADLVALLLGEAVDLGAGEGAEEEGAVDLSLLLRVGRVGEREELLGGVEGLLEDLGKGGLGDRLLLVRHGKAAVRDVEHAGGGALVVLGVVEDALGHAVGRDDVVLEQVLALGERQHLGEAVAVELELPRGELGALFARVLEELGQEVLNALIGRAEREAVVVEEVLLLLVSLEDGLDEAHEVLLLVLHLGHGDAARGELEVDVGGEEGVIEL